MYGPKRYDGKQKIASKTQVVSKEDEVEEAPESQEETEEEPTEEHIEEAPEESEEDVEENKDGLLSSSKPVESEDNTEYMESYEA